MLLPTLRKTMVEIVDPLKFDELETVPKDVVAKMGEMGAFGTTAPAEYGGGGMTHTMSARASEELGAHDLGTSIMLGAHISIGYKGIVLFGVLFNEFIIISLFCIFLLLRLFTPSF